MNPTSGAPVPPDPEALSPDIPDAAFGFADDVQNTPQMQPAPSNLRPVTVPPRPAQVNVTAAPARPVQAPTPAPAAPVAGTPLQPAPAPQMPPTPPATPSAPLPTDVLPPRQVPPVPTLEPAAPVMATPIAASPLAPAPTPLPAPAPQAVPNIRAAEPIPLEPRPLAAKPAQAAPVSASYSPAPVSHLPEDIAERITETPIQNSTDVSKEIDHGTGSGRLKSLLSFLVFTAAIFVAAFLINQFIFQSYYVEGTSMTPTLQNNDRLIISKVERTLAAVQGKPYIPKRGQIVVLDSSIVGLNGQKEQLIKRVIGLPGDHIHIDNGTVTVTNSEHPNGYDVTQALGLTNLQPTYSDSPIDLTIPNGQVYVMGDNREQGGSYDSRSFGPIDGDKIQGRLWARILPFDHAQLF